MSYSGGLKEPGKRSWIFILSLAVLSGFALWMSFPTPTLAKTYTVTAYGKDSFGRPVEINYWYKATKPVKQPDGSFTLKNYWHDGGTEVQIPAGVEFIIEEKNRN